MTQQLIVKRIIILKRIVFLLLGFLGRLLRALGRLLSTGHTGGRDIVVIRGLERIALVRRLLLISTHTLSPKNLPQPSSTPSASSRWASSAELPPRRPRRPRCRTRRPSWRQGGCTPRRSRTGRWWYRSCPRRCSGRTGYPRRCRPSWSCCHRTPWPPCWGSNSRESNVQEKEDGTTHVGVNETEVLLDIGLILAETRLEEDEQKREAARSRNTDEASTCSRWT